MTLDLKILKFWRIKRNSKLRMNNKTNKTAKKKEK